MEPEEADPVTDEQLAILRLAAQRELLDPLAVRLRERLADDSEDKMARQALLLHTSQVVADMGTLTRG